MSEADTTNVTAPAVTPETRKPDVTASTVTAKAINGVTDTTKNVAGFLSRVLPWPKDGEPGYCNLHWRTPSMRNAKKMIWRGKPTRTVDEFLTQVKWESKVTTATDIYMCMSQQRRCEPDKYGKQKALRSQADALALKAIWLDVDIKDPPKGYASLDEAMNAVTAFVKAAGLPSPSALIGSGHGLHVYWVSKTPLTPDEWRPYAEGLKAAALKHRLRCDAGLTSDAARILRVPGTFNHKTEPPLPVKIILLHDAAQDFNFTNSLSMLPNLAAAVTSTMATLSFIMPNQPSAPTAAFAALPKESLAEGIEREEMPPLDPRPILMGCGFFREAFKTGGRDYAQPLWNLTTFGATFMKKGEQLAHDFGNKHPAYTPDDTKAMWERKLRERQKNKSLGWPSCATIQGEGCTACAACPHLSKGKSPLHLALQEQPPSPSGDYTGGNAQMAAASGPAVWSAAELKVSFSNIPHRQWLYGFDLVRGETTVIGSPGGIGKSSLAIGMAISIATGKELLGEKVRGGDDLKVLLINAEDGGTEIQRRVWAFSRAHNIAEHSLNRLNVAGADNARVQRLSFLRTTEKNLSTLDQSGFEVLEAALKELRPDVIILDPLVAFCGGGNMNDNTVMSLVMRELKRLAAKFDCAALLVHHTRKGGDAGNAEAISGAAAIVNLARRAIMPVTMGKEEADKFGVLPSEQLSYFKLVDAKSNLAPRSADSPWYRLHSVELPNPEPPLYPHGDNVQAITREYLPLLNNASTAGDDLKVRRALLDLVARGKVIDGQSYPYSPSIAGAKNERALLDDAIAAVRNATASQQWGAGDLEAVTKRTIDKMKTEGSLIVGDMTGLMSNPGRFRKGRGLKVEWSRTPWSNANTAADTAASDVANEGGGQLVNSLVN
jgi:hypothetical protein